METVRSLVNSAVLYAGALWARTYQLTINSIQP